MAGPWLHRYVILVALCTLAVVITGVPVSDNTERPLYSLGQSHVITGTMAGILTIGLVVWLSLTEKRTWLRRLGWIVLGIVAVESLLGLLPTPQSPVVRTTHALLAQLIFSAAVAIVVFTSRSWQARPNLVEDALPLRPLAILAAILVLAQVALGVSFRHGFTEAAPHVLTAFLVVLLMLVLAMCVIYRPRHAALRPIGIALLIVTGLQFFLGLGLFSMMGSTEIDPFSVIVAVLVHAATGALTLAASIVMALLVWRRVCAPVRSLGSSAVQEPEPDRRS